MDDIKLNNVQLDVLTGLKVCPVCSDIVWHVTERGDILCANTDCPSLLLYKLRASAYTWTCFNVEDKP